LQCESLLLEHFIDRAAQSTPLHAAFRLRHSDAVGLIERGVETRTRFAAITFERTRISADDIVIIIAQNDRLPRLRSYRLNRARRGWRQVFAARQYFAHAALLVRNQLRGMEYFIFRRN